MEATARRKQTTIRLPDYLLADISAEARRQGISISRFIENIAQERMYPPNAETLAAIEECRSGVELEPLDLSSFESFMKSLE